MVMMKLKSWCLRKIEPSNSLAEGKYQWTRWLPHCWDEDKKYRFLQLRILKNKCFVVFDYHINDFVSVNYGTPKYPFHFLVPTDDTLYREPHTISYSQKLKRAVFHKLRETDGNNITKISRRKIIY